MELFGVLLVDDDYLVLQDLKLLVDWEELRYRVVATARNGKTAMEAYKKHKPHLIICDISMPVVNGLDFIEELRHTEPSVHILILSSYDNFEYAQRAIKSGIHGYLLKNEISRESLSAKLLEISKDLDSSRYQIQRMMRVMLSDYLSSDLPNEDFIGSLRLENANHQRYKTLLGKKMIFYIFTAHMPLEVEEAYYRGLEEHGRQLYLKMQDVLYDTRQYPVVFYIHNFVIVGCYASSQNAKQSYGTAGKAVRLQRELKEKGVHTDLVFYLQEACNLAAFRTVYRNTLSELFFYSVFPGLGPVAISRHSGERVAENLRFDFTKIFTCKEEPEEFYRELAQFMEKLCKCKDSTSLKNFYGNILEKYTEFTAGELHWEQPQWFELPEQCTEYLNQQYALCLQAIKEEQHYSQAIQHALEIIQKRYMDSNISIEQIATTIGISTGHLSLLFKKETGTTVYDSITDLRVDKAIKLLRETNLKVYEVTEQVGYQSSQYFSQVLQKRTGKRPLDFRRSRK